MSKSKWLSADILTERDFRHSCRVISSSKSGSLVAKSTFWVWHLLLLLLLLAVESHLAQARVVLHEFKSLCCVALVLCSGVIVLTVFCTHNTNDFSSFAFLLCHGRSVPTLTLKELRAVWYPRLLL